MRIDTAVFPETGSITGNVSNIRARLCESGIIQQSAKIPQQVLGDRIHDNRGTLLISSAADNCPGIGHEEDFAFVVGDGTQQESIIRGCLHIPFTIPAIAVQGIFQVVTDNLAFIGKTIIPAQPCKGDEIPQDHIEEFGNPETFTFQEGANGA